MKRLGWCLVLALGCGDDGAGPPPEQHWYEGAFESACGTDEGAALFDCANRVGWEAIQWRQEERGVALDAISDAIVRAESDSSVTDAQRATLYWRRVQIGVAMLGENGDGLRTGSAREDLVRATELAPSDFKIGGWKALFDMFVAYQTSPEEFATARARVDALFESYPDYTLPVVMGVAMAMPLDTGYPQEMARRVEDFDCSTFDWCERATAEVPFQQAGIELLFAEIHARVGDRAQAEEHLRRALAAPRASHWPYRFVVEEKLADLDGWLATFAARGDSEPVFDLTENNGRRSCLVCHGPAGAPVRR
ncbi:MAG: hypothetical protein H6722_10700 [Sandaracinus sp.]|nr:hypothetical protein [Sandaracinus sp.]